MKFIKKTIFFFIFTLALIHNVYSNTNTSFNHPDRSQSFALQQELRVFYKYRPDLTFLFEGLVKETLTNKATTNHSKANQKTPELLAFKLGALYRIHPNLKIGLHYQVYSRRNFTTGNLNTEHIPILDFLPRFKVSNSIVFELRIRNEFNLYTGNEQLRSSDAFWYTVKLRPKLTYFWIKGAELKLATYFAYEALLPINYDGGYIEHRVNLGLLIPIGDTVSLNPYYALRITDLPNTTSTRGMTHIIGTGLILKY